MTAVVEAGTREIVATREGAAGIVRLNRPKALNALTLPMVRTMRAAIDGFAADPDVAFLLFEGEGERAFCAGGDIRAIHDSGRADGRLAADFWREEYELNGLIARSVKPIVVLMRGIVMGGGAGLSIHAAHRVVTDDTRFAMPEVGIGFVPDVGSTYRLARAPGGFGRYLAYTGVIVTAADAIAAGLADLHVPAARLIEARDAILALPSNRMEGLREVLGGFAAEPAPGIFAAHRALIDRAFAGSVDEALDALKADGSPFAEETRAIILSRSPTSLRLTDLLIHHAAAAHSIEACLNAEFAAALRTLSGPDFFEGVRAAVIDKDRNPRWSPASLAEVPPFGAEALEPPAGFAPPFSLETQSR